MKGMVSGCMYCFIPCHRVESLWRIQYEMQRIDSCVLVTYSLHNTALVTLIYIVTLNGLHVFLVRLPLPVKFRNHFWLMSEVPIRSSLKFWASLVADYRLLWSTALLAVFLRWALMFQWDSILESVVLFAKVSVQYSKNCSWFWSITRWDEKCIGISIFNTQLFASFV